MRGRLAALQVRPPDGEVTSPAAERFSGRRYRFDDNALGVESIVLDLAGREPSMAIETRTGRHRLRIGSGGWQKSRSGFAFGIESNRGIAPQSAVAASGAWTDEAIFSVKVCLYETPFNTTVTFVFEGDALRLKVLPNVAFGPREPVTLIGKSKT